jgi:hypothetical protein
MTFLIVRCPSSGQSVAAGIASEGIDRLPKVGTRMPCPLCGTEHFWTSRDVWFAEPAARQGRHPLPELGNEKIDVEA